MGRHPLFMFDCEAFSLASRIHTLNEAEISWIKLFACILRKGVLGSLPKTSGVTRTDRVRQPGRTNPRCRSPVLRRKAGRAEMWPHRHEATKLSSAAAPRFQVSSYVEEDTWTRTTISGATVACTGSRSPFIFKAGRKSACVSRWAPPTSTKPGAVATISSSATPSSAGVSSPSGRLAGRPVRQPLP